MQDQLPTNVSVRVVLAYGTRPVLSPDQRSWAWGSRFQLNTSSELHSTAQLHVPYPEFGLWFLGLLPLCYLDEGRNGR